MFTIENIFGLPGCQLPNGELCTACCTIYEVRELQKPASVPCPHRTDAGCALHNTSEQPNECKFYFCGLDASPNMAWGLIYQTQIQGDISLEEANKSRSRYILP